MRVVEVEARGARYRVGLADDLPKAISVTRILRNRIVEVVSLQSQQAKGAICAAFRELKR